MPTVDEVIADLVVKVTKETSDVDSLLAFIAGLKTALADALNNAGQLTQAQQAAFNGVFAGLDGNDKVIVDAMAANVP